MENNQQSNNVKINAAAFIDGCRYFFSTSSQPVLQLRPDAIGCDSDREDW